MRFFNSKTDFGFLSIILHWVTALLVAALFALGLWMKGLDYYDPWYFWAPRLHMVLGMTVLVLVAIRVVLRLISSRPDMERDVGFGETILTFAVQNALYLLLVGIVFAGYLSATADGRSVDTFGWFELPAVISGLPNQADVAREMHRWLAYGLAALVILHILGVLKRHFVNRDRTLLRMLPYRKKHRQ